MTSKEWLISKIYKQLIQLNIKKAQSNQTHREELNRHFPKNEQGQVKMITKNAYFKKFISKLVAFFNDDTLSIAVVKVDKKVATATLYMPIYLGRIIIATIINTLPIKKFTKDCISLPIELSALCVI